MAEKMKGQYKRRYRYYGILEVGRNANPREITQAYRRLAKVYHPDVNPKNLEALEKFKKINEAYEVISNPRTRDAYDKSPSECPACWTDKVMQTVGINWRCQRCGCKYDHTRVLEVIEQVEKAAISDHIRSKLRIFQTTQCSHCSKFYTQPFLCPDRRMVSNCVSFNEINEEERRRNLGDKKWWWRITDMLQQVQEKGIMARCRKCGALNPNPQKTICWQCREDSLCCPSCRESPYLRYYIEEDLWKCPSAGCGKKFNIGIKKKVVEEVLSHEICQNCSNNLHYDPKLLLWKCKQCKSIYTYNDLHKKRGKGKAKWRAKATKSSSKKTESRAEYSYSGQRSKVGPRRSVISLTALPLFLVAIACAATIVYALINYDQLGQVAAIGILVPAVILTLWNAAKLRWLWKYRPRKVGGGRILFSVLLATLLISSTAAYTNVEPFYSIKEKIATWIEQTYETITDNKGVEEINTAVPTISTTTILTTDTVDITNTPKAPTTLPDFLIMNGFKVFDGKRPPYSRAQLGYPISLVNNTESRGVEKGV